MQTEAIMVVSSVVEIVADGGEIIGQSEFNKNNHLKKRIKTRYENKLDSMAIKHFSLGTSFT